MDSGPQREDREDPDDFARKDALRFVGRRLAIWALPLTLVGVILVGLGIPWWITVVTLVVTLGVVVFEIDL